MMIDNALKMKSDFHGVDLKSPQQLLYSVQKNSMHSVSWSINGKMYALQQNNEIIWSGAI